MKIVIPTIGSRGDTQPYIALGQGLQRAGHQVVVASHLMMEELVTAHGVPFAPIGPDVDIGREAARMRGSSRNWLLGFRRVMHFTFAILEKAYPHILDLCRGADLVVVSHSGAGSIAADALDLPEVSVTLFPQAIPAGDPSASVLRQAAGKLAGAGMAFFMTRPLNQIRKRLGLSPLGPEGITSKRLNLVPVSPTVAPPDPRWEPRHRVTGYWFVEERPGWSAPPELLHFLEAGEPPVVVSLGAMSLSGEDTFEAATMTVEALQAVGARAVIQGWDEALAGRALPRTIFYGGSIPHSWLLPQTACLVHHGGFGTTAAGLRAGIPAVVIPQIIDQFIWGRRVHELGAGPQPISRSKLTGERLASALERALGEDEMRDKAAAVGERIRAENGVAAAVSLIEECHFD